METGKDSYFHNTPTTLSFCAILAVVGIGFKESGTNVCLSGFGEVDKNICKYILFLTIVNRVFCRQCLWSSCSKQSDAVLVKGKDIYTALHRS